ncbi:MAG: protein kinase [Acidimicrobiales bacterium]|nr:protein kinase [Acidimicrobiales bacterium]
MEGETARAQVAVPDRDTVLSERYRLHRLIGAGGMGSVWEAEDLVLHRRVAVKLLQNLHADDPVAAARFEREAQTAARLSHPHLAVVYDYGGADDRMFLVMELLEGETLAHRLRRGALPPDEAAAVMAEAAEALAAAHERRVVHRDVKPANLMLTPNGAKVLDFGIAASGSGAPLTATGLIIGTAAYLAPERVQGRSATPASDVYSLGAVLYEALTGQPAFGGDTPAEVALGHVHQAAPDIRAVAPTVPAELADACGAALAKDPAVRPAASELADRLRHASTRAPEPATAVVDTGTAVIAAPLGHAAAESPPPLAPSGRDRAGRGRLVLLAVLTAAVLAMLLLIAYGLNREDDPEPAVSRSPDVVATATTALPAATTAATAPPTTAAPATTAAPTTAAPTTAAPADAEAALGDAALAYLAALDAGDLDGAWARTSPEFQRRQDRESWSSFWSGFDSIEVVGPVQVEGRPGGVTVPVSFDGRTERYRMTLVEGPTGWLVDGPVGRERGRHGDRDRDDGPDRRGGEDEDG